MKIAPPAGRGAPVTRPVSAGKGAKAAAPAAYTPYPVEPPRQVRVKGVTAPVTPARGSKTALPRPPPPAVRRTPLPEVLNLPQPQAFDLPFAVRSRTAGEHCSRFLHRRVPYDLCSVVAHWVALPAGTAVSRAPCRFTTKSDDLSAKRAPTITETTSQNLEHYEGYLQSAEHAVGEGDSEVYAAAFMVGGVSGAPRDGHVLHRIACLVQGDGTASGVSTVGCKVPLKVLNKSHAPGKELTAAELKKVAAELGRAVQAACGVKVASWTALVEFQYKTQGRTVVFIPNGLEGDIAVGWTSPQGGEVQGEGEGSGKVVFPTLARFGDLLQYECPDQTSRATTELLMAADAYDEFLTRDYVQRIYSMLEANRPLIASARQQAAAHRAAVESEKQRVVVARETNRAKRERDEKAFRDSWHTEDEGKTDGQKMALAVTREAEIARFRTATEELPVEVRETTRRVCLRENARTLECFQYLDRQNAYHAGETGTVSHDRLSALLLCLGMPELQNLTQVEGFLSESLPVGTDVPYTAVSSELVGIEA